MSNQPSPEIQEACEKLGFTYTFDKARKRHMIQGCPQTGPADFCSIPGALGFLDWCKEQVDMKEAS